jgi:hypothetical protein
LLNKSTGSGDIRNIIRTINELPSDYSGQISILLNDQEPTVLFRNITLLSNLAINSSEVIAAECALYAWYSTFIPSQYEMQIGPPMTSFLMDMKAEIKDDGVDYTFAMKLGPTSNLCGTLDQDALGAFGLKVMGQINTTKAREELNRVR